MSPGVIALAALAAIATMAAAALSAWSVGRWLFGARGGITRGLGGWLLVMMPPGLRERQARLLVQSDLEGRLGVESLMGLRGLWLAACLSGALLAAAANRPWPAGVAAGVGVAGLGLVEAFLRRRRQHCEQRILKELPAYLDAMTVCVEAGATLHTALRIAVDKAAPSPARVFFERLLREIRMGRSRVEALNLVARLYDIDALATLVAALVQSEEHGMGLGTVLRAQSQQRATERQLRAEKAEMKAPVKMLGPLVLCVFPCTFIVIAVPVVVRMFTEGR